MEVPPCMSTYVKKAFVPYSFVSRLSGRSEADEGSSKQDVAGEGSECNDVDRPVTTYSHQHDVHPFPKAKKG